MLFLLLIYQYAVAREHDQEHLLNLIELIIGFAVLSEHKAVFIQEIFSLNPETQMILKDFIEKAMSRLIDVIVPDTLTSSNIVSGTGISKEEREKLLGTIHSLEETNSKLEEQNKNLQEIISKHANISSNYGMESSNSINNNNNNASITQELFEVKRDLDAKNLDFDELQSDYAKLQTQFTANKELLVKLEVENQMMNDQMEISRETHSKLLRAEASIEKYQKKLEELNSMKLEVRLLYLIAEVYFEL